MKTYCEGSHCKKRNTCIKHQIKNTEALYEYIDWSTHGGGQCWRDGEGKNHCETWFDCGDDGNYKLYTEAI